MLGGCPRYPQPRSSGQANGVCREAHRERLTVRGHWLRAIFFTGKYREIPGNSRQAGSDFSAGSGILRRSAGYSMSWQAVLGQEAVTRRPVCPPPACRQGRGRRVWRSGRRFLLVRTLAPTATRTAVKAVFRVSCFVIREKPREAAGLRSGRKRLTGGAPCLGCRHRSGITSQRCAVLMLGLPGGKKKTEALQYLLGTPWAFRGA